MKLSSKTFQNLPYFWSIWNGHLIKHIAPISKELDMYLPVLFQNIGSMAQLNREEVGHKYMLFFLKKWIWLGKLETNLKKSFYI